MLLGIVAFALVTYGVVLEFDHSIRNSLPEADRDAAIWKCATKLSGKDSMEATNLPVPQQRLMHLIQIVRGKQTLELYTICSFYVSLCRCKINPGIHRTY